MSSPVTPTSSSNAHSAVEWAGLEQIPAQDRHGSPARISVMWFAAQLVPTAFFLGALGAQSFIGLSFGYALTAIVLGTALGALAPAALGLAGPLTGLPQLAQSKSMFGRGITVVGLMAFGTSIAFIALGAIFGADALRITFGVPFLPASILVFSLVAVVSVVGYRFMHQFERVMAVVVGAGFLAVTVAVLGRSGDIALAPSLHGADAVGSFTLMTAISCGFTFAWAHNAADYCRYLPADVSRPKLFVAVFVGITVACVWLESLGLAAGTLLPDVSAMAAVHDLVGGGTLGSAVLFAMFLGVVANATVAQYSAGLQLLATGIRMSRPVITVGTVLVAFALALYLQAGELAPRFTNVMLLASYWVGPFVGIVAIFWWQRPRMDTLVSTAPARVRELPWNGTALFALLTGFIACLPFSNTTFGSELAEHGAPLNVIFGSASRALHGADLAYPAGLLVGAGTYLLLEGVRALRADRASRFLTTELAVAP